MLVSVPEGLVPVLGVVVLGVLVFVSVAALVVAPPPPPKQALKAPDKTKGKAMMRNLRIVVSRREFIMSAIAK